MSCKKDAQIAIQGMPKRMENDEEYKDIFALIAGQVSPCVA